MAGPYRNNREDTKTITRNGPYGMVQSLFVGVSSIFNSVFNKSSDLNKNDQLRAATHNSNKINTKSYLDNKLPHLSNISMTQPSSQHIPNKSNLHYNSHNIHSHYPPQHQPNTNCSKISKNNYQNCSFNSRRDLSYTSSGIPQNFMSIPDETKTSLSFHSPLKSQLLQIKPVDVSQHNSMSFASTRSNQMPLDRLGSNSFAHPLHRQQKPPPLSSRFTNTISALSSNYIYPPQNELSSASLNILPFRKSNSSVEPLENSYISDRRISSNSFSQKEIPHSSFLVSHTIDKKNTNSHASLHFHNPLLYHSSKQSSLSPEQLKNAYMRSNPHRYTIRLRKEINKDQKNEYSSETSPTNFFETNQFSNLAATKRKSAEQAFHTFSTAESNLYRPSSNNNMSIPSFYDSSPLIESKDTKDTLKNTFTSSQFLNEKTSTETFFKNSINKPSANDSSNNFMPFHKHRKDADNTDLDSSNQSTSGDASSKKKRSSSFLDTNDNFSTSRNEIKKKGSAQIEETNSSITNLIKSNNDLSSNLLKKTTQVNNNLLSTSNDNLFQDQVQSSLQPQPSSSLPSQSTSKRKLITDDHFCVIEPPRAKVMNTSNIFSSDNFELQNQNIKSDSQSLDTSTSMLSSSSKLDESKLKGKQNDLFYQSFLNGPSANNSDSNTFFNTLDNKFNFTEGKQSDSTSLPNKTISSETRTPITSTLFDSNSSLNSLSSSAQKNSMSKGLDTSSFVSPISFSSSSTSSTQIPTSLPTFFSSSQLSTSQKAGLTSTNDNNSFSSSTFSSSSTFPIKVPQSLKNGEITNQTSLLNSSDINNTSVSDNKISSQVTLSSNTSAKLISTSPDVFSTPSTEQSSISSSSSPSGQSLSKGLSFGSLGGFHPNSMFKADKGFNISFSNVSNSTSLFNAASSFDSSSLNGVTSTNSIFGTNQTFSFGNALISTAENKSPFVFEKPYNDNKSISFGTSGSSTPSNTTISSEHGSCVSNTFSSSFEFSKNSTSNSFTAASSNSSNSSVNHLSNSSSLFSESTSNSEKTPFSFGNNLFSSLKNDNNSTASGADINKLNTSTSNNNLLNSSTSSSNSKETSATSTVSIFNTLNQSISQSLPVSSSDTNKSSFGLQQSFNFFSNKSFANSSSSANSVPSFNLSSNMNFSSSDTSSTFTSFSSTFGNTSSFGSSSNFSFSFPFNPKQMNSTPSFGNITTSVTSLSTKTDDSSPQFEKPFNFGTETNKIPENTSVNNLNNNFFQGISPPVSTTNINNNQMLLNAPGINSNTSGANSLFTQFENSPSHLFTPIINENQENNNRKSLFSSSLLSQFSNNQGSIQSSNTNNYIPNLFNNPLKSTGSILEVSQLFGNTTSTQSNTKSSKVFHFGQKK